MSLLLYVSFVVIKMKTVKQSNKVFTHTLAHPRQRRPVWPFSMGGGGEYIIII